MRKRLLIMLALTLALAGCTDPVREEKARAIRLEAEADSHVKRSEVDIEVLATATAVALLEEAASMRIAATATAIADSEEVMAQTQDDRVARKENLIWWSTISGVIVLLAIGVALSITSTGGAVAVVRKAQLQARLVSLDKTTRTWPILLDLKTGYIVDLETGERARLGDVHSLDHRRLIISGQVRTTGLLAQAATEIAKSTKSARPGDMLPAIGQSVPLLEKGGGENAIEAMPGMGSDDPGQAICGHGSDMAKATDHAASGPVGPGVGAGAKPGQKRGDPRATRNDTTSVNE